MSYRSTIAALLVLAALAVPAAAASAAPSTGAIVFSMVTEDHRTLKNEKGEKEAPKAPEGGIYAVRDQRLNQLTEDPADGEPSFSADGRTIAFTREGDVFTMRADGTGQRQLTRGPEIDSRPLVSPNGRYVLFQRSAAEGEQRDLYTVRLGGGAPHPLSVTAADEHEASISPDGCTIAFVRSVAAPGGGTADDIYTVRPAGIDLRRLTRTPGIDEFAPHSLDETIVYSRGQSGEGPAAYADIYAMDENGSDQRKLIAGAGSSFVEDATASGRTLLFRRDQGLWVKQLGGKGRKLTELPDNSETNSVFSSDGRQVAAFTATKEGQSISVIDAASGRRGYAQVVGSSDDEVTTTIGPVIAWQPVPRH
jgi:dipeptidyl aminopeptidase/acylaminoacyl peptidase